MSIQEQVESQARWLVTRGRECGESDISITIALRCLMVKFRDPIAKVAIRRVINDMRGCEPLKLERSNNK